MADFSNNGLLFDEDNVLYTDSTATGGTDVSRRGMKFTSTGHLRVNVGAVGNAGDYDNNGMLFDEDGAVYVTTDAVDPGDYRNNGFRFAADGALRVSAGAVGGTDTFSNGLRFTSGGALLVAIAA